MKKSLNKINVCSNVNRRFSKVHKEEIIELIAAGKQWSEYAQRWHRYAICVDHHVNKEDFLVCEGSTLVNLKSSKVYGTSFKFY